MNPLERDIFLDIVTNNAILDHLIITPDDFTDDDLKKAFVVASNIYRQYKSVNIVDVMADYTKIPEWLLDCIPEISGRFSTIGLATHKIQGLRMGKAMELLAVGVSGAKTMEEMRALIEQAKQIDIDVLAPQAKSNGELVADYLKGYEQIRSDKAEGVEPCIMTGFEIFDEKAGLQRSTLTTLAARTGVGKSALALTWACNAMMYGQKVLYISLEMDEASIMGRIAAQMGSIPLHRIRKADMTTEAMAEGLKDFTIANDGKFSLYANPYATVEMVESIIRSVKDADLVVIDHLHYFLPPAKELGAFFYGSAATKFHNIAVSQNVAVLLLAQVNRNVQEGKMPEVSEIRESGRIEEASDRVILINRDTRSSTEGLLKVAKNRNGEELEIMLNYEPEKTRFKETDRRYQSSIL